MRVREIGEAARCIRRIPARPRGPDRETMRLLVLVSVLGAAALGASLVHASAAPAPGGVAAGTVSGYRISDVSYGLDARHPERLASVSFALEPRGARVVRAGLDGSWSTCTTRAGRARCAFARPPRLGNVRSLTVVAHG